MAEVTENPSTGDVENVQTDEVIQVGDPRHGVHGALVPERDALAVHKEKTPEEVFGTPEGQTDGIELLTSEQSDNRGPVIPVVTDSGATATPEQAFAADAVAAAQEGADAAAATADARASSKDGAKSSKTD